MEWNGKRILWEAWNDLRCGFRSLLYCKRQDKRWFIKTRRLHITRMHCDTGYPGFLSMGYANMEFHDDGDGGGSGRGNHVC